MRTTTALKTSATYGGPAVFGAGAAMLAAALVTSTPVRPEAAGPQPTATVSVSSPAGVRRSSHPAPSSSSPAPGATLLAEGEPARTAGDAAGDRMGAASAGGSTSPARPSPSPEPPATEAPSTDVRVRLPLGVLPDVGLDLTIGGSSR